MEKLKYTQYTQFSEKVRFFGRCYDDAQLGGVCFNWTLSGFEVAFEGSTLDAEFKVFPEVTRMPKFLPGTKPGEPSDAPREMIEKTDYPVIGVFEEGSDTPYQRIELKEDGEYRLYDRNYGVHKLKIIKLSEGMKGQNAVLSIRTDGQFTMPAPSEKKTKIEFIGDSITCGFGNETNGEMDPFLTTKENGWMTYGAIAARRLNADMRFICVSGIAVSKGKRPWPGQAELPSMEAIYEYTDRPYEMKRGLSEARRFDFSKDPVDAVVINLGTNDHNVIRFSRDMENNLEEEEYFVQHYLDFLKTVRACNGAEPPIFCTLGPCEHFLFDRIKEAVEKYRTETGDDRIHCMKYDTITSFIEGIGSGGHPTVKTHERMAGELEWLIRKHLHH